MNSMQEAARQNVLHTASTALNQGIYNFVVSALERN